MTPARKTYTADKARNAGFAEGRVRNVCKKQARDAEPIVQYHEVGDGPESERKVNAAFDVLFEAVFRKEELQRFAQPKMSTVSVDGKVQLGVPCLHGISHERGSCKVFSGASSDSRALAPQRQSEGIQAGQGENGSMADTGK